MARFQGVLIFQIILHDQVPFGTSTKCVDYALYICRSVSSFSSVQVSLYVYCLHNLTELK